ncbi:DegT/DnrJ/EryC1/StrS family aminotransferase [Corticicoccus populi]|uniref:DegT/DnrJ/EryC1/StrS family aminotransferase n=1 Tax=Corticicoccus populi TaxID=1812821 RepID=A0ABW5WVK4_9STAP
MDKIYLSSPHMGGDELTYVNEAFDTNWIAPLGKNVTLFEKKVTDFVNTTAGCAVSSGTAGLHLSLDLLGVKRGDVVFCSSLTFAASAFPITYLGAEPVFIDSDTETWNMSPAALRRAFKEYHRLGKLPKAVVIVNLYGQSADMDKLLPICEKYNVPVVEDAAESLGAVYKGKMSGTFGRLSFFSFNGNKIITTSGGGMIVSSDAGLIEHGLKKATQAREDTGYYEHKEIGYNYRLSNISAGIGCGQMNIINERIEKKRDIFKRYIRHLSHIPGISFMPETADTFHTRWLTTLRLDPSVVKVTPAEIINILQSENIEARHVWKPMHMQPVYSGCDYFEHGPDCSKILFEEGLCLPSDTHMTHGDIDRVSLIIKEAVLGTVLSE